MHADAVSGTTGVGVGANTAVLAVVARRAVCLARGVDLTTQRAVASGGAAIALAQYAVVARFALVPVMGVGERVQLKYRLREGEGVVRLMLFHARERRRQ